MPVPIGRSGVPMAGTEPRHVWALRILGVAFAAYAGSVFIAARPQPVPWVHELVPIIVPLLCAGVMIRCARQAPEARTTWWLFAAGSLSWAAGDAVFTVLDHIGGTPATSLTIA